MRRILMAVCVVGWAVSPLLAEGPSGKVTEAAKTAATPVVAKTAAMPAAADVSPLVGKAPPAKLSDVGNAPVAPPIEEVSYSSGPIVSAGLTWFTDKDEFEAAAGEQICLEDYEESTLPPNSVLGIPDPLCSGVPNTNYPNGLEGCDDMCMQSNLGGGNPAKPNPRGAAGIAIASVGFLGATSDIAISNTFVDSNDTMFDSDEVGAVGGSTIDAVGAQQGVDIRVYDVDNNLLGQQHFNANIQGTNFMGVISDDAPIGRINVFSPGNGAEGLDNVQLHKAGPPPGCILPDNGEGTVDLPPVDCLFEGTAKITEGLPQGTEIQILIEHVDPDPGERFPDDRIFPGGLRHEFVSVAKWELTGTGELEGFERSIVLDEVPIVAHTAPPQKGQPVQKFPGEITQLQGELRGDRDFALLRVVAGRDFQLRPSRHSITLVRLPGDGSDFCFEGYIDVEYQIDFEGAEGSEWLKGLKGSTRAESEMQTGHCEVPCGEKANLTARCRKGGTKVIAKLKKATPNTQVTFKLDGGQEQPKTTNKRGKAKGKWTKQEPGKHTVSVCHLEKGC